VEIVGGIRPLLCTAQPEQRPVSITTLDEMHFGADKSQYRERASPTSEKLSGLLFFKK
jgi:hypothetical protein